MIDPSGLAPYHSAWDMLRDAWRRTPRGGYGHFRYNNGRMTSSFIANNLKDAYDGIGFYYHYGRGRRYYGRKVGKGTAIKWVMKGKYNLGNSTTDNYNNNHALLAFNFSPPKYWASGEPPAQTGGGDELSTNFLSNMSWTGFVAASKKGYNIINNEAIRQGNYNNSIRKPGMPLDDVSPLKVPKGLKIIGKYGGWVFTLYGAYDINNQWSNNEISTGTMMIEQVSNGIGAIPVFGTGWSIGWNFSKSWGPSTWYGTNDYKWFE
jgi:hypothetical protein